MGIFEMKGRRARRRQLWWKKERRSHRVDSYTEMELGELKRMARRGSGVKHAPTGRKPARLKVFCGKLFIQPRQKAAMFLLPVQSF